MKKIIISLIFTPFVSFASNNDSLKAMEYIKKTDSLYNDINFTKIYIPKGTIYLNLTPEETQVLFYFLDKTMGEKYNYDRYKLILIEQLQKQGVHFR